MNQTNSNKSKFKILDLADKAPWDPADTCSGFHPPPSGLTHSVQPETHGISVPGWCPGIPPFGLKEYIRNAYINAYASP